MTHKTFDLGDCSGPFVGHRLHSVDAGCFLSLICKQRDKGHVHQKRHGRSISNSAKILHIIQGGKNKSKQNRWFNQAAIAHTALFTKDRRLRLKSRATCALVARIPTPGLGLIRLFPVTPRAVLDLRRSWKESHFLFSSIFFTSKWWSVVIFEVGSPIPMYTAYSTGSQGLKRCFLCLIFILCCRSPNIFSQKRATECLKAAVYIFTLSSCVGTSTWTWVKNCLVMHGSLAPLILTQVMTSNIHFGWR